jgi:hypothetical protein
MMASRKLMVLGLLGVFAVVAGLLALNALSYAQDEENLITLELRDSSLEAALRLIFRPPNSFVLEPGVTGTVTVSLHDVTFSQALRTILDMNGLTYVKESNNLYRIVRREERVEPTPPPTVETPASELPVFWIGAGGKYELQALDSRVVAAWFGGYMITPQPLPIPMAVGAPGGAMGGALGGGLGGGAGGGAGGGLGGGYGGGTGAGGGGLGGGGGGLGGGGGGLGGGGGGTGGGGGGTGGGGGGSGGGGGGRGGGGGGGGGGRGGGGGGGRGGG